MSKLSRRESLKVMALAPLAASFTWGDVDVEVAQKRVRAARAASATPASGRPAAEPAFFTEREYETVRVLADMIIPADERSGSATDAGVPEFIDFMMVDRPQLQTPMRGGLAWIDAQCVRRYGKSFGQCSEAQRKALLDEIAYPERAEPELSHGAAFFDSFRDLVATGFWTSKAGIEDLQYMGNTFVQEWNGCPQEALEKLGVSYEGE